MEHIHSSFVFRNTKHTPLVIYPDPDFDGSGTDPGHRFPIRREQAALKRMDLESCISAYSFRKGT